MTNEMIRYYVDDAYAMVMNFGGCGNSEMSYADIGVDWLPELLAISS